MPRPVPVTVRRLVGRGTPAKYPLPLPALRRAGRGTSFNSPLPRAARPPACRRADRGTSSLYPLPRPAPPPGHLEDVPRPAPRRPGEGAGRGSGYREDVPRPARRRGRWRGRKGDWVLGRCAPSGPPADSDMDRTGHSVHAVRPCSRQVRRFYQNVRGWLCDNWQHHLLISDKVYIIK
jgi:hypothetical protein